MSVHCFVTLSLIASLALRRWLTNVVSRIASGPTSCDLLQAASHHITSLSTVDDCMHCATDCASHATFRPQPYIGSLDYFSLLLLRLFLHFHLCMVAMGGR